MDNESMKNMDPNILVSMINMKLRDFYSSLDNLVEDLNLDKDVLISKLENSNYIYNKEINQFK